MLSHGDARILVRCLISVGGFMRMLNVEDESSRMRFGGPSPCVGSGFMNSDFA